MKPSALASALLLALPAVSLAWETTVTGAPATSAVKAAAGPYLALELGCGAKAYFAEAVPPPAQLAGKEGGYTFYLEGVRDNPAYLAHVMKNISPNIALTLSESERAAAFEKASLTFKAGSQVNADGNKLYALVDRLKTSPEKKAAARRALADANTPDNLRGLRRALRGILADKGLSREGGPENVLTMRNPVQQKVLLQHALRSSLIWDLYSAGQAARKGADADRLARLNGVERLTNVAMDPILTTELTLELALETSLFQDTLYENSCAAAPR